MDRLFTPDGIVGTAITEITCEMVMNTGRALVLSLSRKLQHRVRIFVGRDTRLSSEILENSLIAGICSAGADVVRLGVIPSAAVAYLTKSSKADAGVMVTASHHPYEMNGLKIFSGTGYRISEDVEDELENTVCRHPEIIPLVSHERVGRAIAYKNAEWDYIRHLLKLGRYDFTGIRAVIDCANGCASSTAEKLFSALGVKCIMINDKPDGQNINSRCGVRNTASISRVISERHADIGLVFDGDVGKCLALDENGDVIDGDQIMSMLSLNYKKEGKLKNDKVVITDTSNLGFRHFAESNDIEVITSRPGEKCITEKLLDGGFSLGGEQNGKVILPELSTTADGLLTAVELLDALKKSGQKMSEFKLIMEKYPQVMINVGIQPQFRELWKNNHSITDLIEKRQYGLGDDGRIFVRESGLEPFIRVMVEGRSFEKISRYANEISDKIKEQTSRTPVLNTTK
ncbi:MAG: phosphoglucosamine mutase [Oscillospiraceae bacterium]|nr:phosphoglucosamine mutase [Oscillospiraceae bacterium]